MLYSEVFFHIDKCVYYTLRIYSKVRTTLALHYYNVFITLCVTLTHFHIHLHFTGPSENQHHDGLIAGSIASTDLYNSDNTPLLSCPSFAYVSDVNDQNSTTCTSGYPENLQHL